MDFNIQKPTHILALLGLIFVFIISILIPILTFLNFFPSSAEGINSIPPSYQILFEIILIVLQLVLTMGLFIGVPFLWYSLVNRLSIRHMLARMQIKKQELSSAVLWGVIAMFAGFLVIILVDLVLLLIGFDVSQQSNIQDLDNLLSLPGMFIILSIQPIAEEVFYRGFLLEKINTWKGPTVAILLTSILFGIAHLSYAKIYPMAMTAVVGAIFAFFVLKTKNLMTGIIAHILFNVTSFSLYYLAQSVLPQALIL